MVTVPAANSSSPTITAAGGGDGRQRRLLFGRAHQESGLRVADEIFHLGGRIGGIERQKGGSGAQRRQIEHDGVDALLDLRRHSIIGPHTERLQGIGAARGVRHELLIAEGAAGRVAGKRCRRKTVSQRSE